MKKAARSNGTQTLISKVYANRRYRGKWLIVIHGKVFHDPTGTAGVRKFKSLLKRYPGETPTMVYVPQAETLILIS